MVAIQERVRSAGRKVYLPELRREGIVSLERNPRFRRFQQKDRVVRRGLTNPEDASLMEILDRVLDHGIVVDPPSRIRLLGLETRALQEHLVIDWRKTHF